MKSPSDVVAFGLAALAGIVLWLLIGLLSGRSEAWDSSLYWSLGYPCMLIGAALLGYAAPRHPWRWGLTLMLIQCLPLALASGSGSMLPFGLILLGVLALPPMALATLAGRSRRG